MRTMFTSERISECISYQLPSSNWSNSYVKKNIRNSNKIVNIIKVHIINTFEDINEERGIV